MLIISKAFTHVSYNPAIFIAYTYVFPLFDSTALHPLPHIYIYIYISFITHILFKSQKDDDLRDRVKARKFGQMFDILPEHVKDAYQQATVLYYIYILIAL